LMLAARNGSNEIARALLDRKANPNAADHTGRTALAYAREARRGSVGDLIRRAGGRE
ncbi:MAG: ankyrin repeat domain-containing protein, partial [Rhodospirillales bacterium]|nr:ankyrin repeat domain-containing protein [Rhodospirillales bacterium]